MSLKIRIFLTLCITFAFLTLAFLAISHSITANVVAEVERDEIRQNVERALNALQREIAAIDKNAEDWATWDDTYTFVKNRNQEYAKKNLVDSTFQVLKVNYMLISSTDGEVVYARGYDLVSEKDIPIPQELVLLIHHKPDSFKGLVTTPDGPVLVAVRPILKSSGSGPARGTLLFGCILNDAKLKELSELTRLHLTLLPPEAVDSLGLQSAGILKNGDPCYYKPISPEENAGFAPIRDLRGKANLYLQVNSVRYATRLFQLLRNTFVLYLVLAAAACFGLIMLWLDRTVVSRLKKITDYVTGTDSRLPASSTFTVLTGNDELAHLSSEIKKMLDRLEEYRHEISDKEKKYNSMVENAAEAIVVIQDDVIKFANRAATLHTGYLTEEFTQRHFLEFIHPEDRERVRERHKELMKNETLLRSFTFRVIAKDGSIKWAETNSVVVEWEGRPATLHFLTDITPRKILEDELQRLMAEKSIILDNLTELVAFIDRDMHVIWANRTAAQSVGKSPSDLFGGKCHEIWHGRSEPCPDCPVVRAMETGTVCTGEVASPDGRFWSITASPVMDERGNITGAVEATLDVTERKRYEEHLRYLSLHDPLTGLYNRAFFQEELKRLSFGREYPVTVLVADLDGLKLINDTMGHTSGDEMLKACADILRSSLRHSDILARIGGDEFAVLLPKTDERAAEDIVRRISSRIDDYNREHPALPLHISTGFATSHNQGKSLEETLKEADDQMYRHKLTHRTSSRKQIINALITALKEKEYIIEHAEKLKEICLKMGERLRLSPRQLEDLSLLVQVYDLGMVTVPDDIILKMLKKEPLTEEEREVLRQHSEKGYRIALSSPDLAGIADLILKHHERWDGKGYPLGLKGEEIPVECRILSIADAFCSMTSGRLLAEPLSEEEAVEEIRKRAGSQFDPNLVDVFVSLFTNNRRSTER